ncbi:MAG: Hsp20 family protein [Magnetovibrionaceae bacterium]
MRTFDLTPLHRFAVGFDRMQRQLEHLNALEGNAQSYPPYNVEQLGEDNYRVTLAVAGFSDDDLDITQQENSLIITGRVEAAETPAETTYLHRGIAGRAFERRFELADHIKVQGAELVNGLLTVDLVREVPEAKKPRKIEIGQGSNLKSIEQKAA